MPNVLSVFQALRDYYISYYETPFELRDPGLSAERRALLLQEGEIFREPLLEVTPGFAQSGLTLRRAGEKLGLTADFASFVEQGLFPSDLQLFTHQLSTLEAATKGRNFVVTAGTGSGKTETFLFPVIYRLVEESRTWPSSQLRPNTWWKGNEPWKPQRLGETRQAAIRCIILYPMNALVEDQLRRLRTGLDSDAVRRWLDDYRGGNRFYFGRYTGRTPVSGEVGSRAQLEDLRGEHRVAEATANRVREDERRRYFFPRLDGAEMRSRWDMIDRPPDILITNYSMLNVMLMRQREDRVFDLTAQWLAEDRKARLVTLVVDELHMYRGTAGTEIALLLRNLRQRLGLDTRESRHQLVIHAASASLTADANGLEYARQFFADPRFEPQDFHIGRPADPPPPPSKGVGGLQDVFRSYPADWDTAENEVTRQAVVDGLASALGVDRPEASVSSSAALSEVVTAARLAGALVGAFDSNDRRPLKLSELSRRLFADAASSAAGPEEAEALAGLLRLIADADVLPVRAHLFFRNIRGAWACSDPSCRSIRSEWNSPERKVGKLFLQPQLQCGPECGSRVLELLYCEICGEALLGGYSSGGDGILYKYLLPDVPNLEVLPDFGAGARTSDRYVVYWPSDDTPVDRQWTLQGTPFEWKPAVYQPKTGRIDRKAISPTGWVYVVGSAGEMLPALPSRCPKCGEIFERRDPRSGPKLALSEKLRPVVRTMGTGFEKISQVLADAVLRQVQNDVSKRKLVVFSDSRQDAAKLSTGLETTHYQDLVRQLISRQLEKIGEDVAAFMVFVDKEIQSEGARAYREAHQAEALALLMDKGGTASAAEKTLAARVRAQAGGPWSIPTVAADAERALLALGVNPAGPAYDLQRFPPRGRSYSWAELYDFSADPPTARPAQDLSPDAERLLDGIRRELRNQFQYTLFTGRGRDLESLGIGRATFAPTVDVSMVTSLPREIVVEAADGAIRILGSRYRVEDGEKDGFPKMPAYLRRYVETVAERNGLSAPELVNAVEQVLLMSKTMLAGYLLNMDRLYVWRGGDKVWECAACRRLHLHASGGVCTNTVCLKLMKPRLIQFEERGVLNRDYFEVLARSSGDPFRLHCEELTGQTDLDDSLRRQRLFQDVTLEEDNGLVDTVDLLSVTTTMEAGVDIGGLQVVMMSNMPPQRFNYQQRVGRAGRRGDPLAIALTVCRGRTHDDFYFRNPERITGDLPPQPYIDLSREQIVRRVVAAEALRLAFRAVGVTSDESEGIRADLGNSPHGQFGSVSDWEMRRDRVRSWLASAEADPLIDRAVDALLLETPPPLAAVEGKDALLRYARLELVDAVDEALSLGPAFQDQLGELLANRGILPMFGFPTRSRLLYQRRPASNNWPPTKNVIDRDLEIAVTQFAPGAQTVKDKAVYTSVGVVGYQRKGSRVVPIPDPLFSPTSVGLCRKCHALTTQDVDACPVCGEGVGGEFSTHQICEPPGFRTDYQEGKPFKGMFEWAPGASRARVSESEPITPATTIPGLGLTVRRGSSRIYSINDNEGQDYEFRKDPEGHGWVVAEAYGDSPPKDVEKQDACRRALASITTTDVLFLGLENSPALIGLDLSPTTVPGRAAWYSFGFLLRAAAARLLDVDTRELRVGLRVFRAGGAPRAEVFLSDDLDNGAGYSTYIAQPEVLRELFQMIGPETQDGTIAAQWSNHAQAGKICDSSCHDCLRDYSNMPFHPLLDWRLALDMADLTSGRSLQEERWLTRAAGAQRQLCEGFGFKPVSFAGVPALLRDDEKIVQILTHPLWSTGSQKVLTLARAQEQAARARPDLRVTFANLFDAIHRPSYILDVA